MKLKSKKSSNQQQTSNETELPRTIRMTAVFYVQNDGKFLTAYSPNPPTAEAIEKAQFKDKTYVWKNS
jgi:hypothetical protein